MLIGMTIGERLKVLRAELGLSGNELANRSGVPQPTISNLEMGKVLDPTVSTVSKLAKVLGVSIEELVGEIELTPRPASKSASIDDHLLDVSDKLEETLARIRQYEQRNVEQERVMALYHAKLLENANMLDGLTAAVEKMRQLYEHIDKQSAAGETIPKHKIPTRKK